MNRGDFKSIQEQMYTSLVCSTHGTKYCYNGIYVNCENF